MTETKIRVGVTTRGGALASGLNLVEVEETFYQPVRPGVLAGWRERWGADVDCLLQAHRDLGFPDEGNPQAGHLRPTDAVQDAWSQMADSASAVGALGVVLKTPASFSPTKANRERVVEAAVAWAQRCPDTHLIWEPRGLWEPEDLASLTAAAPLVVCGDPMAAAPPAGEIACARLWGPFGARRVYGPEDLEDVLDAVGQRRLAMFLFATPRPAADARRLLELVGA